MPFYRTLRLFLLFTLYFHLGFTQNYPSNHYTAANDLPNNAVRSLLVDSNTILWIGTENGVVKKENDEYTYFFEEDGLALNSCWAIAEDKHGKLWFGSYGEGISIYDGYRFKVISEEDGLVHNEITKLFPHGKYMYVGTSNGVSLINIKTHNVYALDTPPGDGLFRVQDFFAYRGAVYVVTYNSGIFRLSANNDQPSLVKVKEHDFIYSVLVDQDSIYSSNKGFFTKNALADYVGEAPISSEKLGQSIIWDYVLTNDHKIYAGAWGIYESNGGIYEVVEDGLVSRAAEFNVPSKEVLSLAYDANFEKLFVGTKDAGLYEISLNPQIKFKEMKGRDILGFARTNTTSAVAVSDGIIISRAGKEYLINLAQLKKWEEDYVTTTKLPLPRHEDGFYELQYTTNAEDIRFYDLKESGNVYWVNTNIGIFAIKASGEMARYVPLHTEEINFTQDGKLIETNPYGGVRVYEDLQAFEFTSFDQTDPHTPTMVVNSLRRGSKTYFLSIFSGLYVWENNRFTSYRENEIWKEKKLKHITSLGRNLAISNEFGDVFILNDEGSLKIIEKIPRAKIPGNSISFLKEHEGTLLIGTEKGITLYKNGRYLFLDREQGLEQPLLSAEVKDHYLSVGSRNGYYIIDLDAVSDTQPLIDQLKLKEVFINNNSASLGPFQEKSPLNLAHSENTILLKFSTNAHPYPNKLTYQYQLVANGPWSLPFSKPEIFLPSLPAEDYEIAVKVSDASTGSSFIQPLLELKVLPPFWKTLWFNLLVVGVLILGGVGFYKFQIRQTQRFEEQKGLIQKRFEETKMEALLAQMNPHFIFNAMNSIQFYIMDQDIDNASKFLGDFAKLIRLNLDHCTKPRISLMEEMEYLQLYISVENTRFNNGIRVEFEIDPEIDLYETEIPTMLLQTFVENVFVHAFPSSIKDPALKISFNMLEEGVLQCKIEDNGIGLSNTSAHKLHKSKGLSLVKERLSLLGYDTEEAVQTISAENEGTSVSLLLQV